MLNIPLIESSSPARKILPMRRPSSMTFSRNPLFTKRSNTSSRTPSSMLRICSNARYETVFNEKTEGGFVIRELKPVKISLDASISNSLLHSPYAGSDTLVEDEKKHSINFAQRFSEVYKVTKALAGVDTSLSPNMNGKRNTSIKPAIHILGAVSKGIAEVKDEELDSPLLAPSKEETRKNSFLTVKKTESELPEINKSKANSDVSKNSPLKESKNNNENRDLEDLSPETSPTRSTRRKTVLPKEAKKLPRDVLMIQKQKKEEEKMNKIKAVLQQYRNSKTSQEISTPSTSIRKNHNMSFGETDTLMDESLLESGSIYKNDKVVMNSLFGRSKTSHKARVNNSSVYTFGPYHNDTHSMSFTKSPNKSCHDSCSQSPIRQYPRASDKCVYIGTNKISIAQSQYSSSPYRSHIDQLQNIGQEFNKLREQHNYAKKDCNNEIKIFGKMLEENDRLAQECWKGVSDEYKFSQLLNSTSKHDAQVDQLKLEKWLCSTIQRKKTLTIKISGEYFNKISNKISYLYQT